MRLGKFDYYKKMPVQAKASLWYTVCNILQKGVSFFVVPFYVRILTTEEYGQYSTFLAWKDIIIIFATLNLFYGVFTKAMVDYDDDRDRYTSCMQGLCTSITALVFIIYFMGKAAWNRIIGYDTITMGLLFAYYVFSPAYTFWTVRQRVEYHYIKMVVVSLLSSLAIPALSIVLLRFGLRERAIIWGSLLVQIAIGSCLYIKHFFKGRAWFIKKYWIHALKFNFPLIPYYLSLIVLAQSDRVMIKYYCGNNQAGIYSLGYQISVIMNVVVDAVNSSLTPWVYSELKKKSYTTLYNVPTKICIILAVMTTVVMLLSPEAIAIIGTKEYLDAIWIVPPVALSAYLMFCYGIFCNIEFYYDQTQLIMVASIIGAMLNILLNAFFIPRVGFVAAGYTTAVCYMVFLVMHYFFMRMICKKRLEGIRVFNEFIIILSCIVLAIIGANIVLLYTRAAYIRYLLIAVLCIVILKYKNEIIKGFSDKVNDYSRKIGF